MILLKRLNQNGSALLLSLLIITIIFIFSSVLITSALTHVKQVDKTYNKIQATNLVNMATVYLEAFIRDTAKNAEIEIANNLDTTGKTEQEIENEIGAIFCDKFENDKNLFNSTSEPYIDADNKFDSLITNIQKDYNNNGTCESITITFENTGTYKTYEEKIKGSFSIKNNSSITSSTFTFPETPPTGYTTSCSSGSTACTTDGSLTLNSSSTYAGLYVDGDLNINRNKTTLTIDPGDLYVNGFSTLANHTVIDVKSGSAFFNGTISGDPNSTILVKSDLYIFDPISLENYKTNSGNQPYIKIEGTLYVPRDTNIPENFSDYCDDSKKTPRGICANDYKYIDESPLSNGGSGDGDSRGDTVIEFDLNESDIQISYE